MEKLYRGLECGHALPLDAPAVTVCPFCEDYEESHRLHAIADLEDELHARGAPQKRD